MSSSSSERIKPTEEHHNSTKVLTKKAKEKWQRNYLALLEYYKENGTCNVPSSKTYECDLPNIGDDGGTYHYKSGLGRWLEMQRNAQQGLDGESLLPEHEALLQKLVYEGMI